MPAYKDKNGSWYISVRYQDRTGKNRQKVKRGFKTKKEALSWENTFKQQSDSDLNMTFAAFLEIYTNDMKPRMKENTWNTKQDIFDTKILPYFGKKKINQIKPADIISWQNELLSCKSVKGTGYSAAYLETIQAQLSAVFNHAVKFYGLTTNPTSQVGNIETQEADKKQIWEIDEYRKFIKEIEDKPDEYYAFEMLYWCGLRIGELLALNKTDFDMEAETVTISKSYQRIKQKDVITTPKTKTSNRTVKMPEFLCTEMQDYLDMQYELSDTERLFNVSQYQLRRTLEKGAAQAGVKRLTLHELRHSHVSMLFHLGFQPLEIADRVGHKNTAVTYSYAHVYATKQAEIADKLNEERKVHCSD